MNIRWSISVGLVAIVLATIGVDATSGRGRGRPREPMAELLVSGLQGTSGSTIGPDGALYVTEGAIGQITRIDLKTGNRPAFATGLPNAILPIGGATDVAFIGKQAYALVTLVGFEVSGNPTVVGIYRVNGPNHSVVANIGQFALDNPPRPDFDIDVEEGLQFAMEPYKRGFLVTDGHHNRLLYARLDGTVTEAAAFGNIVPTGLEVLGRAIFMAEAGPVPHLPDDGRIIGFLPKSRFAHTIASGAPLLVDVEFGPRLNLYGLSQGEFPEGGEPAAPALPNTGALVRVNARGGFDVVVPGLNLPTSLEFVHDTAYVVNLAGEVWRIRGL